MGSNRPVVVSSDGDSPCMHLRYEISRTIVTRVLVGAQQCASHTATIARMAGNLLAVG